MNRAIGVAAVLIAALGLAGCDKPEDKDVAETRPPAGATPADTTTGAEQAQRVVRGTLIYREREALPEDARIRVQLVDVSRADAPASVLAEQTETADGRQMPIPFSLNYADATLDPRHRYAVQAEIRDAEGELHWTTMQHHGVSLTDNSPPAPVELLLGKVNSAEERVPAENVLAE